MTRFIALLICCLTALCSAAADYFHSGGNAYKIISEKNATAELSACGYYDSWLSTNALEPFVSNPETVDVKDGIAKGLKGGEMTTITLTVTDSNGNQSFSSCRVEVLRASDVESLTSDDCSKTEVYSISGLKVADSTDNLSPGIYIVKANNQTKKIIVR